MVREETMPAEAECGMRRFAVDTPSGELQILVMHRGVGAPWDDGLRLDRNVAKNEAIGLGLIQLTARLLQEPYTSRLPS